VGLGDHADPAALAFAVCGGFALLSLLPIVIMDRRMPAGAAYGFLVGMMIRLIGCAAAVWVGNRMKVGSQFTYWMAGAYLYVLMIELILIGRYVPTDPVARSSSKAGQSEGQTA
jgi:apolipoprotein N-acyltransferase